MWPPVDELPPGAFDGERLQGRAGLVAVCFHASWCGFCRSFLPTFAGAERGGGLAFAEADLTALDDPRWDTLRITVVPTLVLFRDGNPVWRRDAPLGVGLSARDVEEMAAFARGL